jgi:hypothetical protein
VKDIEEAEKSVDSVEYNHEHIPTTTPLLTTTVAKEPSITTYPTMDKNEVCLKGMNSKVNDDNISIQPPQRDRSSLVSQSPSLAAQMDDKVHDKNAKGDPTTLGFTSIDLKEKKKTVSVVIPSILSLSSTTTTRPQPSSANDQSMDSLQPRLSNNIELISSDIDIDKDKRPSPMVGIMMIKKRKRLEDSEEEFDDSSSLPSPLVTAPKSTIQTKQKLCFYCKSLEKKPKCMFPGHVDGCSFDKSKQAASNGFCHYCKTLKKHSRCQYSGHIDGQTVARNGSDAKNLQQTEQDEISTSPIPLLDNHELQVMKNYHSYVSNLNSKNIAQPNKAEPQSQSSVVSDYETTTNRLFKKTNNIRCAKSFPGSETTVLFEWKDEGPDMSLQPAKSCLKPRVSNHAKEDGEDVDGSNVKTNCSRNVSGTRVRWRDKVEAGKHVTVQLITYDPENEI